MTTDNPNPIDDLAGRIIRHSLGGLTLRETVELLDDLDDLRDMIADELGSAAP
jgi:hypothetical protein